FQASAEEKGRNMFVFPQPVSVKSLFPESTRRASAKCRGISQVALPDLRWWYTMVGECPRSRSASYASYAGQSQGGLAFLASMLLEGDDAVPQSKKRRNSGRDEEFISLPEPSSGAVSSLSGHSKLCKEGRPRPNLLIEGPPTVLMNSF
ncbi:hypothetical protein, partial [Azospirillum brasilense]|uniref:hypothetical protein n=1 Tax=Azospirillum brasilense TaxID=192 RepID=UPI001963C834